MDRLKTAQNICQLRKQKNLTQKELAERIYVTDKAVSKWERGAGSPDVSILPSLADALGVTIDEILNGDYSVSPLKKENISVITANDGKETKHGRLFENFKRFLQFRYARVIFFMPVLWTCLFAFSGIIYTYSLSLLTAPEPIDPSVLWGLLFSWFTISSVTGFIPLILCYIWHRLGQEKNLKEPDGR